MFVECSRCKSRYDVSGQAPGDSFACRCGEPVVVPELGREASLLRCPYCGGMVADGDARCRYCNTELATITCPRCFARAFQSAEHCSACGAALSTPAARFVEAGSRSCPRCREQARLVTEVVGEVTFERCTRCHGLWLEKETFARVLAARRGPSIDALLGASHLPASPFENALAVQAGYIPCPDCGRMMNRANFARRSGVLLDVCKAHGTWFDPLELGRVLAFAQAGGIEDAQRRELEDRERRAKQAEIDAKIERARASMMGPQQPHEWHDSTVFELSDLGGLFDALVRFLRGRD